MRGVPRRQHGVPLRAGGPDGLKFLVGVRKGAGSGFGVRARPTASRVALAARQSHHGTKPTPATSATSSMNSTVHLLGNGPVRDRASRLRPYPQPVPMEGGLPLHV